MVTCRLAKGISITHWDLPGDLAEGASSLNFGPQVRRLGARAGGAGVPRWRGTPVRVGFTVSAPASSRDGATGNSAMAVEKE